MTVNCISWVGVGDYQHPCSGQDDNHEHEENPPIHTSYIRSVYRDGRTYRLTWQEVVRDPVGTKGSVDE